MRKIKYEKKIFNIKRVKLCLYNLDIIYILIIHFKNFTNLILKFIFSKIKRTYITFKKYILFY